MTKNERDEDFLQKIIAFYLKTFSEINFANIIESLKKVNVNLMKTILVNLVWANNIAKHFLNDEKVIGERSILLVMYSPQAGDLIFKSLFEALTGYYSFAYIPLRGSLEAIINGAYYECLAHKKFRNNPKIPEQNKKGEYTLKGVINEIIKKNPKAEYEFEKFSLSLFNFINEVLEIKMFNERRVSIPTYPEKVKHLEIWKILEPIPNPIEKWREIYDRLSKGAHIFPIYTEVGMRFPHRWVEKSGKVIVIPEKLNKILELIREVVDIMIVINLNFSAEYIKNNSKVKKELQNWLTSTERGLSLEFTSKIIRELLE
jgi:hypothetical protein